MPYIKNTEYHNTSFSSETPKDEFYIFSTVPALVMKSEMHKHDIFLCRTIGILHSTEGRFYLTDIDAPILNEDKPTIRVTVKYLKNPPQSPVSPFPVQIFGTLEWKNRPVIFAKLLQALSSPMAVRLRSTFTAVTSTHLAEKGNNESDFEVSFSELNDTFVVDSS